MTSNTIGSDQVFSKPEREVIAAIAAAMIGEDVTLSLPPASDPAILATLFDKAAHFYDRLKTDLATLSAESDWPHMNPSELVELIDTDARFRSLSRIMTMLVMQSYYQDPRVLTVHGLPARPPFPLGHEVEQGDWSLLDPVKKRKPIYRPV